MSTYHRHIYKEQQSDFSHWETKLQRRDQICVFCKQHDSTRNHPEHDPVFQDNSPRPQTPPKESPGHSLWARQQQGTGRLPSPLNCLEEGGPRQASVPACPLPAGHIGSSAPLDPGRPARRGPGLLCQSLVPMRAIRAEKSMAALGEKAGSFHALENR